MKKTLQRGKCSKERIIILQLKKLKCIVEGEPFNRTVKPGKYPVLLNIIRFENEDERIAYAIIKLSRKSSVKWELALSNGQIESDLQGEQFSGYGVDTGNGCFIDDHVLKFILSEQSQKGEDDIYDELEEALEKSYEDTRSWLVTHFQEKVDLAIFSTGFGDGVYLSFWGTDENGDEVCLVTDFLLMDEMGEI
ncbi:DUF4241 domain-containing protein [Bacillus pumilus]|uniref:DUF4241 domain-containing protein n=1 Tax=Bacillus pumilus TaxID=1408 RepID=UPI003916F33E